MNSTVEAYDHDDEFHSVLSSMNANHGIGDIVAVIWSEHGDGGVFVAKLQYGWKMRNFEVTVHDEGYTTITLGYVRQTKSDYFSKES